MRGRDRITAQADSETTLAGSETHTPSDKYPARLYFQCPKTNCDGHVKLRDRSRHHAYCMSCQSFRWR